MKVLVVTPWYPSVEHPIDGVFVRDQVRGIAQHNEVFVVHLTEAKAGTPTLSRAESADGFPVLTVRWRRGRTLATARQVAALLSAVKTVCRTGFRPDIVHAQIGAESLPAVFAARRLSVPLVVTEQWSRLMDLDPRSMPRHQRRSARLAYAQADAVLAVGHELRSAIKYFSPRARVLVVPNAVDTDVFHHGLRTDRGAGPRRVVTVGRLVDYKGVQRLLAAVRILCDGGTAVHLDIIGDGPARPELEKLAARWGLEHAVVFHGHRAKEDFAPLVAAAHICVVPGDFETFCVAGVEALACGTPVVATACGGPQDYVTPRVGRLVPIFDPVLLADAITDVLGGHDIDDPAEIAEAAAKRYGIAAVGRHINGVYLQLMRNRTVPQALSS